MQTITPRHTLIGIGFGPSNIALAIALKEVGINQLADNSLFVEKQPEFVWHKNMMMDNTHMQISFMKDLVTLRNPQSHFTFINYLHQQGRLSEFINLQTFNPSRYEFNDYLTWASSHFEKDTRYGEEIFDIKPIFEKENVVALQIFSRDISGQIYHREADNLVVSVGGKGYVPEQFRELISDERIFHSNDYLKEIDNKKGIKKIAVIGAGQSAAEIFRDLHGRPEEYDIDFVMRANSIKPSDDSPFVNEIFDAEFTDYVFSKNEFEREQLVREYRQTNYACPDIELIEEIYNIFYQHKVRNIKRHNFLPSSEIQEVHTDDSGVHIKVKDKRTDKDSIQRYDAVILATGYERNMHQKLLSSLTPYLNNFEVDRNYCIKSSDNFKPNIFLQGACEKSHGLSDTLLSVLALRSQEITEVLKNSLLNNIETIKSKVKEAV